MKTIKTLLALVLLTAQLWLSGYLLIQEGWVSAIVFFLAWTIFFGLALRVADLVEAVWLRLFGRA